MGVEMLPQENQSLAVGVPGPMVQLGTVCLQTKSDAITGKLRFGPGRYWCREFGFLVRARRLS